MTLEQVKGVNALSRATLISTLSPQNPLFFNGFRTCFCRYFSEYSEKGLFPAIFCPVYNLDIFSSCRCLFLTSFSWKRTLILLSFCSIFGNSICIGGGSRGKRHLATTGLQVAAAILLRRDLDISSLEHSPNHMRSCNVARPYDL